jgi:ribose 5-phosphate isomerase B
LGGSGQGEAMVANRFKGIRAVVFNGQYAPKDNRELPNEIKISREHNDSNVLSLGARFLNEEEATQALKLWLDTEFLNEERHVRRIKKIDEMV